MPSTPSTPDPTAWPPERLDRLTRGLYPLLFGKPAPGPSPCDRRAAAVVSLSAYRARLEGQAQQQQTPPA